MLNMDPQIRIAEWRSQYQKSDGLQAGFFRPAGVACLSALLSLI